VERLMLLATDDGVDGTVVRSVLAPVSEISGASSGMGSLADRVESFEREVILAELKRASFHMTNAARALGLERSHLYKKAEQLGIDDRRE